MKSPVKTTTKVWTSGRNEQPVCSGRGNPPPPPRANDFCTPGHVCATTPFELRYRTSGPQVSPGPAPGHVPRSAVGSLTNWTPARHPCPLPEVVNLVDAPLSFTLRKRAQLPTRRWHRTVGSSSVRTRRPLLENSVAVFVARPFEGHMDVDLLLWVADFHCQGETVAR